MPIFLFSTVLIISSFPWHAMQGNDHFMAFMVWVRKMDKVGLAMSEGSLMCRLSDRWKDPPSLLFNVYHCRPARPCVSWQICLVNKELEASLSVFKGSARAELFSFVVASPARDGTSTWG